MKLLEFQLCDTAPIRRIEISGLTEVVVLAGPNGVGKTRTISALLGHFQKPTQSGLARLKVGATSSLEQQAWNGAATLDTANAREATLLTAYLQQPKRRGGLRGGVLNFDSSRSFEQIQPLSWSWDFQDPFEEAIGWNYTFQSVRGRFQDVIHSMLRKVRSHKEAISDQALKLIAEGKTTMELQPADPLEKFKQAFARLLPGKTLLNPDPKTSTIQYQSAGTTLPLTSLSSGEREVVTIVFDFLLRDPRDCIVVFDEPELHLHPELTYRLLRTLREAGERNQFIFCTHSPDIITASLDQTVIFLAPPIDSTSNQAIIVREDDKTSDVLQLLGQSVGVISLGRRLVLIEGDRTSLDKQTYGAIIANEHSDLVLVPAGGKGTISTFVGALDGILDKSLWGIEWFMLADGDATAGIANANDLQKRSKGRLRVLPRYHLENYFLDEELIAAVFGYLDSPPDSWLRDPAKIRSALREFATPIISYGTALRVAHSYRQRAGNLDLMPRNCHGLGARDLVAAFESKRVSEKSRLDSALDPAVLAADVEREYALLSDSLQLDDDVWKRLLPAKPILNAFAGRSGLDVGTLKRLYVKCSRGRVPDVFEDIRQIFAAFANSSPTIDVNELARSPEARSTALSS